MLTPDTIRALSNWLLTVTEPPTSTELPRPAALPDATTATDVPPEYALLVLHDGEALDAPPGTRCMSGIAVTIHPALVDTYRGGLTGLLPELAAALTPPRHAAAAPPDEFIRVVRQRAAEALTDVFTPPQPGMRLLACAIAYDDIHSDAPHGTASPARLCTVTAVRRIDAVDTDGRVYQVMRLPGQQPIVVVDDEPDPGDTPATHPGLTALLTAARQHPAATRPAAANPVDGDA